jgi:ubiquinone/menaquinone biosynthesis C-methylase UbiE
MIDDERIHLPTSESNHIPHGTAYVHALPLVKNKVVVDLCCGTGYGTRLLSEAAKFVTGYDYSADAITYNNTRLLPNTEFILADVEELGALRCDVITCMQGLEHLEDPQKLIDANKDKVWAFALPNDQDDTNEFHHHKITEALILQWFGSVRLSYFDDSGTISSNRPNYFTNYFGVYRP